MYCKDELPGKEIYEALTSITSNKSLGNGGLIKGILLHILEQRQIYFYGLSKRIRKEKKSKYFTKTSNN